MSAKRYSSYYVVHAHFLFIYWMCVNVHSLDVDVKTKDNICQVICEVDARKFENCTCPETLDETTVNHIDKVEHVLFCKSDDILSIKLHGTLPDNSTYYLMQKKKRYSSWKYDSHGKIDKSSVLSVYNLDSDTEYKLRIWIIGSDKKIYGPIKTNWLKTVSKNIQPLPVKDLKTSWYFVENTLYTVIEWIPGDLSCYYFLTCVSPIDDYTIYVNKPDTLFKHTIENLTYSQTYNIAIRAHNSINLESTENNITMITPSCLRIHNNLSKCVPEKPENITVDEIPVSENVSYYNFNISWSTPTHIPDRYEICLTSAAETISRELNVSGENLDVVINNVKVEDLYHVEVKAWSPAGVSESAYYTGRITTQLRKHSNIDIVWISVFLFLSICASVIVSILAYYKIKGRYQTYRSNKRFKDLELKCKAVIRTKASQSDLADHVKDDWEISRKDIILQKVLGQGAFGVVRYGVLTKGKSRVEVAAKTLKSLPTREELGHFQHELEIMKSVGSHPHIVSLIGICLDNNCGPILIVEYCSKGDLQNYLQNLREKLTCTPAEIANSEINSREFANQLYDIGPTDTCNNKIATSKDLLSFARQIAKGMEYLSKLKILHRDLAARNVLICEDMTVKVSDFGLSRNVYKDNVYQKKAGGKLPIRWLAVECLIHQQYTTHSDVWSFGILLWEIATLGATPYPGIPTEKLLKFLLDGYRMECPLNVTQELYEIMVDCWRCYPRDRPTFTQISKRLEDLLESEIDYLQVDLNMRVEANTLQINSYKNVETQKNVFERYVKPIFR